LQGRGVVAAAFACTTLTPRAVLPTADLRAGWPFMSEEKPAPVAAKKRENIWLNLLFNVALPSILLMKGKAWLGLAPWEILVIALIFPVAYFFFDLHRRGRRNIISIVGFVGVLITGGVGLLKLPSGWIAIKEAVVPSLFGIAIIVSAVFKHPIIREFLLNPDFFDTDKIDAAVKESHAEAAFSRTMFQGTLLFSASFFMSAALNFILAKIIIHSPSGTDAFNAELGKLHLVSYPVVALPATIVGMYALFHVIRGVKAQTGLTLEDIMFVPDGDKPAEAKPEP